MQILWNQEEYIKAYRFAAEALNHKKVPGTDLPYIAHVSLVAMEVMAALQVEPGLNGDFALQCALLHDVIEDSTVTFEQLKAEFGDKVAKGVLALSKNKQLPESEQTKDSLIRIKKQPREIWIVKMADRITNLQPPPRDWTKQEIYKYWIEAREIYDTLKAESAYMADRLLMKIKTYEKFLH